MRKSVTGVLAAAMVLVSTTVASADIVSFQQGSNNVFVTNYQGTDDNMVNEGRPDSNAGAYHIGAGQSPWGAVAVRSLIRFDLSTFAYRYSAINSITLKLHANNQAHTGIKIYAVEPANKDWVEGTLGGEPSDVQTGSSCWNYKKYSTASWAGSVGCGTAGTDYDATSLATFSTPGVEGIVTIPLTGHGGLTLKDLVDEWSGPQTDNAGLLIKADNEAAGARGWFASSEALFGVAPELIIDYESSGAEDVSFKQGTTNDFVSDYQGTDDNMMYGGARANLNAGSYHLGAGDGPWEVAGVRTLLRFDLSAFKYQYSSINSVTLKLYHDGPAKTGINLYAIEPANKDWVEGTKGFEGETGSSCWNYEKYSTDSWAGGNNGCGTAGTDYDATSLGTFSTPNSAQFVTVHLTGHGGLTLTDLIDEWSGLQADNAGLLIRADDESDGSDRGWFSSSEDSMGAGTAPELTINYQPAPSPPLKISFKQGTTNDFVSDYQGTDDNMMYSSARVNRNGGGYHIGAGDGPWDKPAVTRGLLRFDLSAFAGKYASITSVMLKLYHNGPAKADINLYAINPANNDWVEGTGDLNPGSEQAGMSCWNYKKYNTDIWAGSVGCGTAGIDYDATSLATFSTPDASQFITVSLAGHGGLTLNDLIDEWSGPQADNAGLVIKADDESDGSDRGWFSSSEELMGAGTAPELIIYYSPAPKGTLVIIR